MKFILGLLFSVTLLYNIAAVAKSFNCSCNDLNAKNTVKFHAASAEACKAYAGGSNPNKMYRLSRAFKGTTNSCTLNGISVSPCTFNIHKIHAYACHYINRKS